MKKVYAHVMMGGIDVAAVVGMLYFFSVCDKLLMEIERQELSLVFDGGAAYLILMLVMPLIHAYSLVEYFFPKTFAVRKNILNVLLLSFFVATLLSKILINDWLESTIISRGYELCESNPVKLSKYSSSTYALNPVHCR